MNSQSQSNRMLIMIKSSNEQSYFNICQQNNDQNYDANAKRNPGPVYEKLFNAYGSTINHGTNLTFNVLRVLKNNVLTFCLYEVLIKCRVSIRYN